MWKIGHKITVMLAVCGLLAVGTPYGFEAAAEPSSVSAQSAVLYEPSSGRVLFQKDAHTPRPMASTTKLMTALIAAEAVPFDRDVKITEEAVRVEGSSMGLRAGDWISMGDLVTGLLLESGNDAANAIALTVAGSLPAFAEIMNRKAKELGMMDSYFVSPSGLDGDGHSSSAYDMALLGAEVLRHPELAEICATKTARIHLGDPKHEATMSNHNRLLSLYPYAIGMKTGFTTKAGRCLVSAARKDGVTLVAVTLKAPDDWNDHIALYDYGFSLTLSCPLPKPELSPLPVAGGTESAVPLSMEAPPSLSLLKEEAERLSFSIELPRFLAAPVAEGETVGVVRYSVDGRDLCVMPVTAAQAVEARPVAGYGERVYRLFRALLCAFLL